MHTYTNPFHSVKYQGSKAVITTAVQPVVYKDHLIFKHNDHHFDVVKAGVLVTQMAGQHGARRAVDRMEI